MSAKPLQAAQERTCRNDRIGPILLQKSPQRLCEIRISNNRIDAEGYLNQCCASTLQIESTLRAPVGKILLQQYRPLADMVTAAKAWSILASASLAVGEPRFSLLA